jgi:hypothetical protein
MAGKVPNPAHAFLIHKGGLRQLDGFGAKTRDSAYWKISYADIQQYLFFETRFDDVFVHMSSIFRHRLGVAIGGACSTQEVSLVLMRKERALQSCLLPPVLRYRDNYLVLCQEPQGSGSLPADFLRVREVLASHLNVGIKIENCQRVLPFLECELQLSATGQPELGLKAPVFHAAPGAGNPSSLQRPLDVFSPNARSALQSFVPNMMGKAAWYALLAAQYLLNVTKVAEPLHKKQYPGSWWRPRMLAQADRIGKRDDVLLALKSLRHGA